MDFTPVINLAMYAEQHGPQETVAVEMAFTRKVLTLTHFDGCSNLLLVAEYQLPKRNPHRFIYPILADHF